MTKTMTQTKTSVMVKIFVIVGILFGISSLAFAVIPSISNKNLAAKTRQIERAKTTEIKNIISTNQQVITQTMPSADGIGTTNIGVCWLEIDEENHIIGYHKEKCKEIALANYASSKNDRDDLFYIIKHFYSPLLLTRQKINQAIHVRITFTENGIREDFSEIINRNISGDSCADFKYLNVDLNCFNEIPNIKKNHTKSIIRYITFLKISSRDTTYAIFPSQNTIKAFDNIINHSVTIYDASVPSLVQENGTCASSGSGAHTGGTSFSTHAGQHKIFICPKHLPGNLSNDFYKKKVHVAGLIFHETLHFDRSGHEWDKTNSICTENRTLEGSTDFDINSVYGGQVQYLLDISRQETLLCTERKYAYERANFENNKLCNPTEIGIPPLCD